MTDWKQFKTEAEAIAYIKAAEDIPCGTTAEARAYIREQLPKESYYQHKIIKHIKALIPAAFVWKASAGSYSQGGVPDICAVINGRYYGFEVKRPLIGVLSRLQEQTIKKIQAAGGRAYVVTWPEEVTEILKEEVIRC